VKEIKKGDTVLWCKSSYTVIEMVNKKALLKQNFSIGIVLVEMVPLSDLSLIK